MAEKTTRPATEKVEKKKSAPARRKTAATPTVRKPRRVAAPKQEVPAPVVESAPEMEPRRRPLFQAGTWISILMLAALVGLAFYMNREKEKTAAESITPTVETAFLFTQADGLVSSIEIQPAEGDAVKIERNAENAWAVILPIATEADQGLAESAATQLTALRIATEIEDGKSPAIFGLEKPAYVITVEFKTAKRTLEIGDTTPTYSGYYVRLDKGKMFIVPTEGIEALLQLTFFPPYLAPPATEAPAAP